MKINSDNYGTSYSFSSLRYCSTYAADLWNRYVAFGNNTQRIATYYTPAQLSNTINWLNATQPTGY